MPLCVAGTATYGLSAPYLGRQALQPAPYPRAVAAIDVSELALEIGFLAGDHTVADDKREGHQPHQQPEAVEGNGQADEPQHHAEIDGVAREAVGASLHARMRRRSRSTYNSLLGNGSGTRN